LFVTVVYFFQQRDYGKVIIDLKNNYTILVNNTLRVLNGMNKTCRYYTEVNSYKHQLQEVLFHNDVLPDELLEKITSLLINLQVAANSLQHVRVRINTCIDSIVTDALYHDVLELHTHPYR